MQLLECASCQVAPTPPMQPLTGSGLGSTAATAAGALVLGAILILAVTTFGAKRASHTRSDARPWAKKGVFRGAKRRSR